MTAPSRASFARVAAADSDVKVPASTVAEIDLGALAHNLAEIRRAIRPGVGILAAVKADAYGHGAVPVARTLERQGVSMLGVARIEEGIELRLGGVEIPILVLSGVPSGGVPPFESLEEHVVELLRHRLTPVLFDVGVVLAIDRMLQKRDLEIPEGMPPQARMNYHLKIDTGMGRLGIEAGGLRDALAVLSRCKNLRLTGALTHFADADSGAEAAQSYTKQQFQRFQAIVPQLRMAADENTNLLLHACNSAAALAGVGGELDLVRPGIALYGCYPEEAWRSDVTLKPVMRLTTRVLFVKEVAPGTPISYGRTFVTERTSRIATLPVGYGDGYTRALSNKGHVLIRGIRAPIVGRVCMDLTMVDVTNIPGVVAGDEVVLIGTQGEERMTAEELASKAGTISYEIFTSISKRVPRIFRNATEAA